MKTRPKRETSSIQEYIRTRMKIADNRIPDDKLDAIGKKVIEDNIDFFKRLADK